MSYPCAYCGKTMEKYGGGPDIHYAQCWECFCSDLQERLRNAEKAFDRMVGYALGGMLGAFIWGLLLGSAL